MQHELQYSLRPGHIIAKAGQEICSRLEGFFTACFCPAERRPYTFQVEFGLETSVWVFLTKPQAIRLVERLKEWINADRPGRGEYIEFEDVPGPA